MVAGDGNVPPQTWQKLASGTLWRPHFGQNIEAAYLVGSARSNPETPTKVNIGPRSMRDE